jgi:hypothetical protein
MLATRRPFASLPRIVGYLGTVEASVCPHCGARGKIVHRLVTADGRELGAMSGCINLFPMSPVAAEHKRLHTKREKASRTTASGRSAGPALNRWDTANLDAIESFLRGETTEGACENAIWRNNHEAKQWRERRFGR